MGSVRRGLYSVCHICGDTRPAEEVEALADETGLASYECKCGKMLYVRYSWGFPASEKQERITRKKRPKK